MNRRAFLKSTAALSAATTASQIPGLPAWAQQPAPPPHSPEAMAYWVLAFGVALYLLSDKWFRRLLALDAPDSASHWRGAAAVAAVFTLPIGLHVSSEAQIASLVAVLVAMLCFEHRTAHI